MHHQVGLLMRRSLSRVIPRTRHIHKLGYPASPAYPEAGLVAEPGVPLSRAISKTQRVHKLGSPEDTVYPDTVIFRELGNFLS